MSLTEERCREHTVERSGNPKPVARRSNDRPPGRRSLPDDPGRQGRGRNPALGVRLPTPAVIRLVVATSPDAVGAAPPEAPPASAPRAGRPTSIAFGPPAVARIVVDGIPATLAVQPGPALAVATALLVETVSDLDRLIALAQASGTPGDDATRVTTRPDALGPPSRGDEPSELRPAVLAWCADRAATAIHRQCRAGVLIRLGASLASAGPPPIGGWLIGLDELADGADAPITIWGGGLATALADPPGPAPRCSRPAAWRAVTVAAPSALAARTAAAAAIGSGHSAPFCLQTAGLSARLVRANGAVLEVGGWPSPWSTEGDAAGD